METSLIISIIIAVVSLLMVPFCMYYCKRCAIQIIDNVGSTSTNSTNANGTSSNNVVDDDDNNNNSSRTRRLFRWNRQNNDDATSSHELFEMNEYNINGQRLSLEERKELIKREKKILKRVVVKKIPRSFHSNRKLKITSKNNNSTDDDNKTWNDEENKFSKIEEVNKTNLPQSPTITNKGQEHLKTTFHSKFIKQKSNKKSIIHQKWKNYLQQPTGSDFHTLCGICLEQYNIGDEVCFSINQDCDHIFHKKCILSWLMMRHEDCPNCRSMFLAPINNNNVHTE